ncbi:metal-dependent hydrolase [uncultured Stenotrophomonas sp.]|uniref:metal-dependent hydrolase n=1 Tax=uncultured Stenotrophomonas sp. TaxID=165438 RepID=UPI0025EE72A0|nr:metal-dependent hydrolase [uncultured Stenotrophomonas sp.]
MPSIITHAAVPLALWCAADRGRIPPRLLAAGVVAAMLPDADVLAFALHIPYADAFGHRGASHSLLFACALAILAALLLNLGSGRPWSAPRSSGSRRPWSAVSCQPRLAPTKARPTVASTVQAAVFVFVCAASHPLLDALTSGGLGVALAWPGLGANTASSHRGGRSAFHRLPRSSSARAAWPPCSPNCAGCGCRWPAPLLPGN